MIEFCMFRWDEARWLICQRQYNPQKYLRLRLNFHCFFFCAYYFRTQSTSSKIDNNRNLPTTYMYNENYIFQLEIEKQWFIIYWIWSERKKKVYDFVKKKKFHRFCSFTSCPLINEMNKFSNGFYSNGSLQFKY